MKKNDQLGDQIQPVFFSVYTVFGFVAPHFHTVYVNDNLKFSREFLSVPAEFWGWMFYFSVCCLLRMKEVTVGDQKVLLVRTRGQYSAVGSQCSHYGAPLIKGNLGNIFLGRTLLLFLNVHACVLHICLSLWPTGLTDTQTVLHNDTMSDVSDFLQSLS